LIEPRTLKGFRDYLPAAMLQREVLIETARRVYRSYGFSPIDTPALEYFEILAGKGGEEADRQIYAFKDQGGRKVGLRFDLTVPLARFAAQHISELGTPLKRYHIATVWRGEAPQRGRYREFMQCDFDIVGADSVAADIETTLVIIDLMKALGFERFAVRLNHRGVLNGLLEKLGLADSGPAVLRALDKIAKIPRDKVADEMMAAAGATAEQVDQVLSLSEMTGDAVEVLRQLEKLVAGAARGEAGVARLKDITEAAHAAGAPPTQLRIDPAIARGLDYYTGVVFETFLDELPGIGSVCSGGRYDHLAERYTRRRLPGVGASLGLDRLLAAMEELQLTTAAAAPCPVFIPWFAADALPEYLKVASALRGAGLGAEVSCELKKLGKQLQYADRRGFSVAVIAGPDELQAGRWQVKDLATKETQDVGATDGEAELIAAVRTVIER